MATPGVGQDIEDMCTRCGDTWHVVMAKVGERVVKVVCKLCGSQHNYRGEKQNPTAKAGGMMSLPRRRKSVRSSAEKEQPVPAFDPKMPPRNYSPKDSYGPGERIVHPTFGTGVVVGAKNQGKVDVQFPSGERTLACAKNLSTLERPVAVNNLSVPDSPTPK